VLADPFLNITKDRRSGYREGTQARAEGARPRHDGNPVVISLTFPSPERLNISRDSSIFSDQPPSAIGVILEVVLIAARLAGMRH
jgi:hypothetical protein